MRSLVLVPFYRRPQASGHRGAHVAFQRFLNGYLNKVSGFWDLNKRGIVQCKMRDKPN
jgi:hypothetical protein